MFMKKLLIASYNPAKVTDYKRFFSELKFEHKIVSLKELGETKDPEETGETFDENSLLKAKYWAEQTGLLTIADDGGLMIDALGGAPGPKSRRWPGYVATDEELIKFALEQMKGIPEEKRTARLGVVLTIYNPRNSKFKQIESQTKGIMLTKPTKYKTGYPFNSLFYIPRFKKTYGQLSQEEFDQISHRRQAVEEIRKYLNN
jgi:XTP/dITP diphosphohydrolase